MTTLEKKFALGIIITILGVIGGTILAQIY